MNGVVYLFDSDWVIDFLNGKNTALDLVRSLLLGGIAISAVMYGEVYEGVVYGRHRHAVGAALRSFLDGVTLLAVDQPVAERFAEIRGDLLIAATAIHTT